MTAISDPPLLFGDPRTDPAWADIARTRNGHLFLSPPWLTAVCDTYGFRPRYRIVRGTERPCSGIAWVPVTDMCGTRTLSLPFADHGTPVLAGPRDWPALSEGLATGCTPLTVRAFDGVVPDDDPLLRRSGAAAWHGTEVDPDTDAMFARLSGHARRNVRLAERAGVRVRIATGVDAVRTFHALHRRLRRDKYRLLAQPWELFERIWTEFHRGDAVATALAELDGRVIAGAIFLQWNDVLYYKFGASLQEHLAARPNDAVFWAGLRLAAERGLRLVDWGLSDLDQPGLVDYKRKWSPQERTIVTWRKGGETAPDDGEQRALLGRLTEMLTDPAVPDEVTDRAGVLLYRYFC